MARRLNFAGHEPVQLIENSITNGDTGVLIQSEGSATLLSTTICPATQVSRSTIQLEVK